MNIREVWDHRLSTATPVIDRTDGTWVVKIYSKTNPDYVEGAAPVAPLATHDTGIEFTDGDEYDTDKLKTCYEWLRSVRDTYALPDIEERKPLVAKINAANEALAELGEV